MCHRNTKGILFSVAVFLFVLTFTGTGMAAMYLKPTLRIDEKYDNNPSYESDAQATAGFVTVISPELGLLTSMRNMNITGTYTAEAYLYQKVSELNYVGHSLNLSLDSELNRDETVNAGLGMTYSEDSLPTLETGIQTQRTKVYSNALDVAYKRILDANTSVSASLAEDVFEFEDPELVDTTMTELSVTGKYAFTRDISTELEYAIAFFTFDAIDPSTNTLSNSLEAGVDYTIMPDLTVTARLGSAYFTDDDNAFDWTGSFLVQKSFRETSVNVKYSRELTHSAGLEEGLNDKDAFSAGIMHTIMTSLNVSLAGYATRYSPIKAGAIDIISYSGSLRILYQPASWMSVGAGYARFHQFEDTENGAELDREQVYMNLIIHPFEWRLN